MASERLVAAVRVQQSILIFKLDGDSMLWTTIASAINPEFTISDENLVYWKLALSSDGSVVAIGDEMYGSERGQAKVFTAHPDDSWRLRGYPIDGENVGDWARWLLALSADSTAV